MNKTELIEAIAARSNVPKSQTATMLRGLIGILQETLTDGNDVQLISFSTFSAIDQAGREAPNPITQHPDSSYKKVVKFKSGKNLADIPLGCKLIPPSKSSYDDRLAIS